MSGRVWEAEISVNGARTVETVIADNYFDAKKLIEARYPHANITWWRGPTEKW